MDSVTRHDVLNQITVITGYTNLMLEIKPDPDELKTNLSRILSAGQKIQGLIEFTRNYQQLGVEHPIWYRIRDIFSRALIKPFYDKLTLSADVGELAIYADRMLEKVFYNLLDNTIRHG